MSKLVNAMMYTNIPKKEPTTGASVYRMTSELQVQDTKIGAKARIGLNEAPVNGNAKTFRDTVAKPIAIGAVTFFEMTERLRQVLHRITHVIKKEPNTSNTKPDVNVDP